MSTNNSSHAVVARFTDRDDADQGMTSLLNAGFPPEHIGLVQPNLLSAEVTDVGAATTAAEVLRDSRAIKIFSPVAHRASTT
jgi:hypothetical protein